MSRPLGDRRHIPYKVIDTWIYKVKDVTLDRMDYIPPEDRNHTSDKRSHEDKYARTQERVINKTVKLELRLEKTSRQSEEPPHPTDTVKFELVCDELNFKLEGTDIEVLKATMWGKLDKKFEVKWERYYLVEIVPARMWGGADGTGFELRYHDVYKGTTWDGKLLMKKWSGHEEKIQTWPGAFKNDGGKVIACIEANETNREALKQFGKRIDMLREKLAEFLRPETIMQTLTNLAALKLLPPAEMKEKEAARDI
jgi:hypothetical protein